MSSLSRRTTTLLLSSTLAVALAACSGTGASSGSESPSTTPSTAPSGTPGPDAIDHPTGATDVVLRYEEGGGFVMPAFAATLSPHFTLYGDGTIVFRDPSLDFPTMEGNVARSNPMRTATITEEQVQDLLAFAIGEGGLAAARPDYPNPMIADASTALFTIAAGGLTKTVSIYALGMEGEGVPDGPARAAFSRLAQTLTSIESGGRIAASDYIPTTYRGVLFEAPGVVDPGARPWPWATIAPTDFAPAADPNGLQFPHRTMTPAEVEQLGISGFEGGLQNVTLTRADGSTFTFSLRPLLPDEAE